METPHQLSPTCIFWVSLRVGFIPAVGWEVTVQDFNNKAVEGHDTMTWGTFTNICNELAKRSDDQEVIRKLLGYVEDGSAKVNPAEYMFAVRLWLDPAEPGSVTSETNALSMPESTITYPEMLRQTAARIEMDNIRTYPMLIGESYYIPLDCKRAAEA